MQLVRHMHWYRETWLEESRYVDRRIRSRYRLLAAWWSRLWGGSGRALRALGAVGGHCGFFGYGDPPVFVAVDFLNWVFILCSVIAK